MIVPVPSFPTGQVPPMAARPEPGAPEGAAPGFAALMSAQQGRAAQGDAAQTDPPKATAPLDELQGDLEAVAQDGLARLVAAGRDETAQAEAIAQMQTGLSETIAAFDAAHGTELGGLLPSGAQEAGALPAMVFSVPPGSAQAVVAVQAAMGGAAPERAIAALTRMSNLLDTAATAMDMDPAGSTTAGPMAVAAGIMPSATAPSATAPSATAPSTAMAFMPAEASGDPSAPMQPFVPGQAPAAPRGAAMIAAEPRPVETPAGLGTEKAAAPGQPAPPAGTTISQPSAPLSFSALVSEAALLGGEAGTGGQDLAAIELPGSEPGAVRGTETAAAVKPSVPAPAPPPSGFSRALTAQIRETSIVEGRTRIALTPGGLGEIEIELSREAGQLKVVIRAENQTVLQALRGDREGLMSLLAESGAAQDDGQLSFESFERDERERQDSVFGAPASGAADEEGAAPDLPAAPMLPEGGAAGDGQLDILT